MAYKLYYQYTHQALRSQDAGGDWWVCVFRSHRDLTSYLQTLSAFLSKAYEFELSDVEADAEIVKVKGLFTADRLFCSTYAGSVALPFSGEPPKAARQVWPAHPLTMPATATHHNAPIAKGNKDDGASGA